MKQAQRARLTPMRLRDFSTQAKQTDDLSLLETQKNAVVTRDLAAKVEPQVVDSPSATPVSTTSSAIDKRDTHALWKSNGGFISIAPSQPSFPAYPERTPPTAWLTASMSMPIVVVDANTAVDTNTKDEGQGITGQEMQGQGITEQGVINYTRTMQNSQGTGLIHDTLPANNGTGLIHDTPGPTPAPRGKQAKKLLGLAFRIGGTILLTYLLLRSFEWESLLEAMEHIRRGNLLVAVLVGIIGVVLSCYQWRSVLSAENIHYDLADLIDLYVVGIAFSHFLPTGMGGDAIKAMRVGRESGNSAGSASAVVMCRVTGYFAMMLIALPVLLLWHNSFDGHLMLWFAALALLVGTMIGVALLCAIMLPRLGLQVGQAQGANKAVQRIVRHRIFTSVLKVGNALYASLKKKRSVLVATLYGVLFWGSAVLNCYSYADAIGIHASLHFYFLVVPFISLIAFLPISINGYGLRESAFVYAFATVHVSAAHALLLALLLDAQGILFGLCGGIVYLALGSKQHVSITR